MMIHAKSRTFHIEFRATLSHLKLCFEFTFLYVLKSENHSSLFDEEIYKRVDQDGSSTDDKIKPQLSDNHSIVSYWF